MLRASHTQARPTTLIRGRGRALLTALAALLAILPLVARPRHVFAQVNLIASNVADHATLDQVPYAIILTFDDRVLGDPASSIVVQVNNRTVSIGAADLDAATGTTLSVTLRRETGDAQYVVS
jgi:methionine-rich copper-binding protein CopC